MAGLAEASDAELQDMYAGLGLPRADVSRQVVMSRLKCYMLWQEFKPAELRKECARYGISATEEPEEIIWKLVLKSWGYFTEDLPDAARRPEFEPPPRQKKASGTCSSKLAGSFKTLGLQLTASQEDVKKSYRRLALQHHPDKNHCRREAASIEFQKVADAYEVVMEHLKKLGK